MSPHKNHLARRSPDLSSPSASAACAQDVADLLFADNSNYAAFAAWLETSLAALETQFADFVTESPKCSRR